MKITDVKIYLRKQEKDTRRFNWRDGLAGPEVYGNTSHADLRIMTDEGIDGYASYSNADYTAYIAKKYFKDLLIGEDPLQKELIYHKIWEIDRLDYLPLPFFGLVDIALWDIASKKAQIPLYQLIGGFREKAMAYASTATYNTIEEFMDVADQCLERGFKGIKLHAWGDARRDAELCQALRAKVGKDIYLMYDGSAGFDYQDAYYLGKALEEANYHWYEEPMREYSIYAYRKLADKLSIPLLVAETSPGSFYNSADFVHFGKGDMVRISAGLKGGVTGAMKIAHMAESFNLRAEVHGGGELCMQLIAAFRNTSMYEAFIWDNPINNCPEVDADGYVHVSKKPGLSNHIDIEKIEKEAYTSFSVLDY
ncbi:enolase C-terminal domain-like protein [Paenibacillus sp. Soil787]|uniref:enolase C-terminal domain-like protein n=1 Tax=Paenibacillus sp. Soil787 TaxID=1736411 RepID=UPI0006FDA999|nr:enolase C-terminal domain-like protein [Paenibacillus sp. Soil787]KRF39121.1 hypothetical protein ASG93_23435 [Paenibacillus sp. Soil787]